MTSKNKQNKKYTPKPKAKILFGVVDGELNIQLDNSNKNISLLDEQKFNNKLCFGDKVSIEMGEGEKPLHIKVAQRAKRTKVEALVSKIGDDFYAISKYASHRLLNYDVYRNSLQKGFEVLITVPKDKEKQARVVLTDSVESSGREEENKQKIDYRLIEPDDLI